MSQVYKYGPKTALVIFNPTAGRRDRSLLDSVLDQLKGQNWRVYVRETNGIGDAERIASSGDFEQTGSDVLIVSGGDGTVNEAVTGLFRSERLDIPVGLVPSGTVNLLASELGFTNSAQSIVDAMTKGTRRSLYLGQITSEAEERIFLVTAGVGFDAHAVSRVSKNLKRLHGKTAYVVAGLFEYVLGSFPTYSATIVGQQHSVGSILVANGKYFSGRVVWAPNADAGKPCFEIGLFTNVNRRSLPIYVLGMVSGFLPKLKGFNLVSSKEIILKGPVGRPVQADGDIVAKLPVCISIAKKTASFFAVAKHSNAF